jgi:feruloyl esterase
VERQVSAKRQRRLGGEAYSYALITPLNRGFAAAVTGDGHSGDGTARFVAGHPEKLIDFGYRAIHETSRQSRVILSAFYGKAQNQANFATRQIMKERP